MIWALYVSIEGMWMISVVSNIRDEIYAIRKYRTDRGTVQTKIHECQSYEQVIQYLDELNGWKTDLRLPE